MAMVCVCVLCQLAGLLLDQTDAAVIRLAPRLAPYPKGHLLHLRLQFT